MANHNDEFDLDDEDFELDDWGMGDDLDGGDWMSDTPANNDRNPVLRLGGKFLSGLGKTFVDPNTQRRMIKDNLPDGFASAFDAGMTGINAYNDIKRDVDRNLSSIVTEAKGTLSRVSPTIEKQLPPALAKRLNEFTKKNGTTPYDTGVYDPDAQEKQSGIGAFLEQVEAFKLKEETTKKNVMNKKDAREVRSDAMQQRLLDAGNRAQIHTNAILNRILGYHTEVTTNYQMKSLELQYNQFFMLRKAVDIGEQSLSLSKDSYDKIIKNTGLPDALKLRTLEHAGFLAKESVLNKLNGKFSETVGSFVQKGVKQIGENLSEKAEELKSAMSDLESMVGMLDMLNGMEDEPPGAREQVIRQLETVFGIIGGVAGSHIEKVARKYAEKKSLKTNSKLVRYSEKIKAFMGGGSQRINSYLTGESDTGVDFLDNTVRNLIGGAGWSQDSKLSGNNYDNLGESSAIDFKTKRTINDVIPGYLKMIHHELLKTRTGDENVSPMSFDWEKNKFNTDKAIGARITEKFTGSESNIAKNAQSVTSFIKSIDPGKELSPETRKTLAGLVSENMANGGSIFDVYTMLGNFNPQGPNAVRQRDELNTFLEARGFDLYADTSNEIERNKTIRKQSATADKFYNSFNKAVEQSRWNYESSNEEYQKLIELGFGPQLVEAGLITEDDDGGYSVNQANIDKKTQRRSYKGFAVGGDTGPGDKYQPKGVVHADEFVVRSEVNKQPGVKSFLNQLNMVGSSVLENLSGYAAGGDVQPTTTTVDNNNKAGVTLESIIDAIRSINPIQHLKDMTQSLRGIEFGSMRDLMGNVEQLPQQMRAFYENNIKNAKPGQSLKMQWDRFTDKAKQNKIWDAISNGASDAKDGFLQGYDQSRLKLDPTYRSSRMVDGVGNYQADIYTEDDPNVPKLTVDGFKNGEYFDEATGAEIKSAKDIRGTVVDKIGNIKLHAKDLGKKLISPSTYVKSILAGTKFSTTMTGKGFDTAVKFASKHNVWGKLKTAAKWSKSKISHLDSDVYIKDEMDEPVLTLKELKEGNYYNGERKQITDYKHITGDIYDKEGNLVLAESRYADTVLVGANGKPLKGFMRKQIRRIKNVAKLGWAGVKGFNKFRKKAWQAQFKLMYGVKDVIRGTKKKTPEQLEEERYNEYMMQNANPDGLDQYTSKWDRFKGKVKGFQKDTRDYLTGERDKRKASEANIGQLLDHDGNPVENKKDAFDTLVGWAKSGKEKLVDKAKDKLGQATGNIKDMSEQAQYQAWLAAKTINNPDRETGETLTDKGKGLLDTAQGKLKTGIDQAKDTAADIAERARLEAWYLKNTINNPDRETGETFTDKAKGKLDGVMKKVKDSIPDWLVVSSDDDEELKRYKATLRRYWMEEQKAKLSGLVKKTKDQVKPIDWKAAEAKVRSLMPTSDDIRYEAKKFEMHLKDKGITKEGVTNSLRAAADKLTVKAKESIPEWMTEFTEDDPEVKAYKAKLREMWVKEQSEKLSGKVKKLKGKAKISWTNAQKQLESMMPNDEQKAKFRATVSGKVDSAKKTVTSALGGITAKVKDTTGKWGLDKDEKGVGDKQYRDKGAVRLIRDIHRLLEDRLPKPKTGLWSDKDNNGFREGSIEDQLADREKNAKKDPATGMPIIKDEKKKPKGLLGVLLAIAGAVGTVATTIAGFIKKAMGMGKFIKDWMTKQAALKAATSVLGGKGGGCCCGCNDEGQDYLDRDERKRRKGRGKGRGRGRGRGAGRAAGRGVGNAAGRAAGNAAGRAAGSGGTLTRLGARMARGPGWMKVAGLAALAGGGAMAMSNGANASEVGGDLIKESYRATPGIGQAVDMYDAYNDYTNPEEGEEKPGLFNNMWNGTKDALGLNSADGVADFAKDTALTTGAMAATTGAIGGLLSGGGVAAGALAALGGPVTLGIILGGAAIYGGIKLYQAMSKGDTPLLSFRLAQYGYKDSSKSEIKLILKLESELAKITRVQGDTVTFTKADEAVGIAIKSLGINTESAVQMKSFTEWFGGRFKPVYFAWVAAVNNVKKGMSLDKVDDSLKPQEKLDLMASVHSEAKSLGAYKVGVSFNAEKALLNGDAVEKVYKSSQNGIEAPQDRATKEKAEATKQEVESQKSSYWEKTKNMFSSAAEGVSNLWDKTKAAGSSFVSGVKDGINSVGTSISNGVTNLGNAAAGAFEQVKAMSGTNKEKYNKIRSAAVKAGDPHPDVVAAQWALESGWGKKQSGKNNYFGIKAGKGEAGTAVRTREVYSGKNVMITDKFKDYNSLEEGIADRVAFIKRNPRYTKAGYFVATTPFQAATALQRGGYATDPNYATLLGKIIKGCGYDPSATSAANTSKAAGASASKPPEAAKAAPKNAAGIPVTLAKPGTNAPGMSLDPSKKPNVSGMAMPGAPKSGASGAGVLADPKKVATVGNTMGTNNGGKYANNKAIKAAKLATEKAAGKSLGYCARYVANALQGAGFKFTRQNSAFQYHTNGIMTGMGFVAINSTSYQIGDVVVWAAHGGAGGGGIHGHIQIFNGKNWVSDFIQRSFVPGKNYNGGKSTLYRDKELVGANVEMAIDSKTPSSDMTNDTNGVDSASPGAAALNTKYSGMTVGDVIKKRKEAKTKVYGADGTATDYDPGSAGSTKVLKADVPTAKTTTTTNPNNTSMKATTIPTGVATGTVLGATVGGKTVDEKKDVLVQQEAAKKAVASQSNTTNTAAQSQAAMRDAKMSNSTSSVGNTSANFPAESIRLFTSMDSKLSQVVTALNKLAVINQDGIKVQTDASNRQAIAMNETAKAMTTVATAAITNKGDAKSQDGKTANAIKPGVIGAGKPQPVSVLS